MRRTLTIAVLAAAASLALSPINAPVDAQRLGPPVKRPRLKEITDTNSAHAYFNAGVENFRQDPEAAAAAFYWAARLDPTWGDPLYARRAALLVQRRGLLTLALTGGRRRKNADLQRLDSLQFRALMLNPFLYRRLDGALFIAYITNGERHLDADFSFELNRYMMSASPSIRGWYAYGNGQFERALSHYATAVKQEDETAWLHLERGRIFGMRNAVDSAVAEFKLALQELRTKDAKDLVVFYDSKAQAEYSTAVLLEGAGQADAAREAYGRALQEDLAYYPAHVRLGLLALGKADTATALSELALAAEIAPEEPYVRYTNGYVLGVTNRPTEAVAELRKALELEPYYALPNLVLGTQLEILGKPTEAVAAYERFLKSAAAADPQRPFALSRLQEVRSHPGMSAP